MATPLANIRAAAQANSKPVVQKAAQRYLNKASNRMETAQQIHSYRAPTPKPVPPQGHTTSGTTHTVTRTTTSTPKAPVSFINKSPAEVEDTARKLTEAEVSGIRGAYAPSNALLGQEEQGALGAHATSYGQLGTTIGGLQTQQAGTAKTFENYAADAINKASTAAPGAAQTAERLGLKPGEALPESAQRQQEAARTLLSGIAQAGQAGTTARQEGEANFLTNMQGTAALGNTEGARNISGQYALQKGKVGEKEQGAIAKAQGNQASLAQKLFGEQEKDRIAATGLNYTGQKTANTIAATSSKITSERAKEVTNTENARSKTKAAEGLNAYRNASLGQKERQNEIKNRQAQERITQAGEKNAAKTGLKLTPVQLKKVTEELGGAFTTFERLRIENEPYATIRQKLASGQEAGKGTIHYYKGKPVGEAEGKRIKIPKVADAVVVRAAEEAWNYHTLSAQTLQQLAGKGLSFASNREAYETITGRKYTPPSPVAGLTGSVNAGVKKK